MDPSEEELASARIVVVDDEPMVTTSLRHLLELELGVTPVCFNDPVEAARHVERESIDLIVSDFLMPGMDGISLLVACREAQPRAPRVLLTGYADKENAIKGINEARLFQYLEKPWENAQLLSVVRSGLTHALVLRRLEAKIGELDAAREDLDEMKQALLRVFA